MWQGDTCSCPLVMDHYIPPLRPPWEVDPRLARITALLAVSPLIPQGRWRERGEEGAKSRFLGRFGFLFAELAGPTAMETRWDPFDPDTPPLEFQVGYRFPSPFSPFFFKKKKTSLCPGLLLPRRALPPSCVFALVGPRRSAGLFGAPALLAVGRDGSGARAPVVRLRAGHPPAPGLPVSLLRHAALPCPAGVPPDATGPRHCSCPGHWIHNAEPGRQGPGPSRPLLPGELL